MTPSEWLFPCCFGQKKCISRTSAFTTIRFSVQAWNSPIPAITAMKRKRKSSFCSSLAKTANFVGCRDSFESRSGNSVAWSRSYCGAAADAAGGGCGGHCSAAGLSSSCGGGAAGSGHWYRRRGAALWRRKRKTWCGGPRPRLLPGVHGAGWSRTSRRRQPAGSSTRGWGPPTRKEGGGLWGKLGLVRGLFVIVLVVASPGAVTSVDAPGQIVIAVVATRVVEEISPGTETVTVDHPSWSLKVGGGGIHV